MNKHIIAAVAAMSFCGFSSVANAAWSIDNTTVKVAVERLSTTSTPAGAAGASLDDLAIGGATFATVGVTPALSRISLILSAGTWSAAPATLANGGAGTISRLGAGTGTNTVSYDLDATALADTNTITIPATLHVNLTGVAAGTDVDISLKIVASDGTTVIQSLSSLDADPLPGTPTISTVNAITSAIGTGTDVAAVASGYAKFVATGAADTVTGSDFTIKLTSNEGVNVVSAKDFAVLTLAGDFTGIASVVSANVTSSLSTGADATAVGVAGTTVPGIFSINAAKTLAYGRISATNWASAAGVTHTINMTSNGAVNAGSFTVAANVVTGGATQQTLTPFVVQAAAGGYTITRNGTAFQMNLITATDQLVLTNNDATAGAVSFVAKDNTGAALNLVAGATALPTTITAGQTLTITGASVLAAYGPTFATLDVNAEAADVNAQVIHVVPGVGASTTVLRTGGNNAL